MELDQIRSELEHMRRQMSRQRKQIQTLARAGIGTSPAEALLARMQDRVDAAAAERDRLVGLDRRRYAGTNKVINGTPASRRL